MTFESRDAPIEGPVGVNNGSYVTTIDPEIPGEGAAVAVAKPIGALPFLVGVGALAATGRRRPVC